MPDLKPLLSPDSVAIVGASADTETLRGRLTHALIGHGYDGRVFPVTRSQSEVLGLRAYPSVAALPEPVDLAVILVPAAHVVETLEQCGERGIRAAVVISSGFAEESNEAARARDVELGRIAERYGIVVCGPNSEGIVNPLRPLVATFSPVFHDPSRSLLPAASKARPIAVSCQSGALTFSFLSRGRDRQLHFTHQVSAGNQTVLEAHDYVDWWLDEGSADIFLLYLEGIRRPERFRAVAEKAADAGKPLIVAKVGRSAAGRRAAASHTGALAQAGDIDDAIFRHHGIIRGEDLDHMLDVAAAFSFCRLAARQPRRGNHRIGRQRGVDGRHPVGARARTPGAGGRHPAARPRPPPLLRLGAKPGRRHRAGDPRGRLRAARRDRPRVEADRHDPADRLARQRRDRRQARRRARRDHGGDRAADPAVDLHDRVAGSDGAVRRSGHPLLHLDAELRPRDPCAGRLRRVPERGGGSRWRLRRPRRECATKSAARWQPPARC